MAKPKLSRSAHRGESIFSKKRGLVFGLILAALVIALIVLGLVFNVARTAFYRFTAHAPSVGTVFLAPSHSKAQHALDENLPMNGGARAATEHLAAQPTAYWLTPEQDPPGSAGGTVTSLISQARDSNVSLALVVYGLPERDCGNHSAGGLPADQYLAWVHEISAALELAPDVQKVVVLEPDSLALAPTCGNLEDRIPQLRAAVADLASSNTWIYLDGGHSGWHSAQQMADLITSVGVNDRIRGFATNVSNYQSTYNEFAYAAEISNRTGGLHAVIDTSRNGAATAGSEWCNPPGQRVGEPSGTYGDHVVDTNIWIKPPGESDGPCHGGPAPGIWWPEGAAALTKDAF